MHARATARLGFRGPPLGADVKCASPQYFPRIVSTKDCSVGEECPWRKRSEEFGKCCMEYLCFGKYNVQ